MNRTFFHSKVHRCTVTHADLHYEGSITMDSVLLRAANIAPFEQVHVWNVTRGTRLVTYALEGEEGSGIVCMNGAAAHLVVAGDMIIVATFCELDANEARTHQPISVFVDTNNRIKQITPNEVPGPAIRRSLE